MASEVRSPTAAVDDNGNGGTKAWLNPTNCFASDDVLADCAELGAAAPLGDRLKATDFDFTIPSGATIDGIRVSVERQNFNTAGAAQCNDDECSLVIGGVVTGNDKATLTNWSKGTDEIVTYGGPTDLWGLTLSDTDINAVGFGFVVAAVRTGGTPRPRCDHIQIEVFYTEGGGGATDLVIQDASHAHSADSPSLTQVHQLAVADASHAHSADSLALTQVHVLVVADALHGHTADNVVLTTGVVTDLVIQNAVHGHSADGLVLTQTHVLAIQDALHAHAADGLALTQVHVLVIADALHAHTADNVVFAEKVYLFLPPTTDTLPSIAISEVTGDFKGHPGYNLFRHFGARGAVGLTVIRNGAIFTTVQTPTTAQLAAADAYYLGGHIHTVEGQEATDLINAGYDLEEVV